jgi:outer membrane protein OmpA-like peptidoglycan-associated protein
LSDIAGEDATVERTEETITVALQVLFPPGRADLVAGARAQLDRLAAGLEDYRTNGIQIYGHVAAVGNPATDLELSQDRADAVRDYLIRIHGFDPAILDARGRGSSEPVASNATEEGRALNRRVEIVVDRAQRTDTAPPSSRGPER